MSSGVFASFLLAVRSFASFSIVIQNGSLEIAPLSSNPSSPAPVGHGSQPLNPGTPVFFPPSGGSANSPSTSDAPAIMTYYPAWAAYRLPPENIDFSYLDWVDFAFAIPTANFTLAWETPDDPAVLHRLVAVAHSHGCKVKVSVGGWTGSKYFSPAVATDASRKTFVGSLVAAFQKYQLDGIDIDWEYPGRDGNPGNLVSPDDTTNFFILLQLLKASLPSSAKISAATSPVPFIGAQGEPLEDVSCFATVLDWILIMNYDTWSASDNPGPNAPLFDGCKNSSQPESSALASFNAWTAAGIPPAQLVLGLPAYGYVSRSSNTNLRTREEIVPNVGNSSVLVAHEGSQALFRDLLTEGALVHSTMHPAGFEGGGGFERMWDDCSSTPFLKSEHTGQLVSYDDPESLIMKSRFARDVGMMGVNIFSIDGDTSDWHLLAAIHGSIYAE